MNNKLKNTIHKLTPAVFTSLIATSLGLLSLFKSKVPMIQDFGMMLAIGIAVAFLLALLALLPILTVRDRLDTKVRKTKKKENSFYVKVMSKVARGISKIRYVVVFIAIISAGAGFYYDKEVGAETDFETFMPQDSEALADIRELRDIIGSTDRVVLMYEADDVSSFDTLQQVDLIVDLVETKLQDDVSQITSITVLLDQLSQQNWDSANYESYLENIPSDQLRLLQDLETGRGVINIALAEMTDEEFSVFVDELEMLLDDENITLDITVTGQSIVEQEMLEAMTSDRMSMTLIGIGLVFFALLVIYRNFFKALIAVLPIILIVGWSGGVMYLLGFDYTPLTSTIGALIIGIGTEFTILILMRFYEFKNMKYSHQESIEKAIGLMSKPIIVSAVTTMGGFSALIFSDFEILSNFGIMTVINISLALISSLIVLPALLGVMGQQAKVFSS
jgi:hydrophobe/amphiphile efflux-3 (HAE3) family protein